MAAHSLIPGQILGHFRLTEKIGAGGMGTVYRAWDMQLERDVAVKVLKGRRDGASERRRLRKEALALSRLNHPNIESIYSIESDGDIDFLVFELLSGSTLADRIQGPLDSVSIVTFGIQIAGAVAAAHQNGVIHRDLKPENIFLTKECGVKVLDFGLARMAVIANDQSTQSVEHQGTLVGTLAYMAPEQIDPGVDDERSDIYSLGAVLYVMATGQRPFGHTAAVRLIDAILHAQPVPPRTQNPSLAPELERIILKCLDKNPDARYQSAREIAIDLKTMLPQGALELSDSRTIPPPPKRRRSLAIAAALVMLVAAAAVILWRGWRSHVVPPRLSVVVAEFENRTGDPAFDQTPRELISTALGQSSQVSVFPSSRLPDVLRRMQKSETDVVNEGVASEICTREGLQSVISGSISKLGNSYLILVRVLNCNGDPVINTQKAFSGPEQLPPAIDGIAATIRHQWGESKAAIQRDSQPLALVTSSSLEALKLYSSGKQQLYLGNLSRAAPLFKKAVEMDGDFAMAHEYLAIAYENLADNDRAGEEYARAAQLSSRVTEREREKILGDYALFQYDIAKAIPHYQILAALSPEDPAVHSNLAECYRNEFRFDLAVSEGSKAVDSTRSLGAKLNIATYYYLGGDSQRAIALAQQLLKDNPDNARALNLVGSYYLGIGKESEANTIWRQMLALGGDAAGVARAAMADAAQTRDNLKEAIIELGYGVTADAAIDNAYDMSRKQILLAELYRASGDHTSLMNSLHKLREPSSPELIFMLGKLYARSGYIGGAKRQLQRLEGTVNRTPRVMSFSNMLQSEIAVAQNRPMDAVQAASLAVQHLNAPLAIETLATANEIAGRREEAARQYELLLARSNERQFESVDSPALHAVAGAHYRLGVLYQSLGRDDLARKQFGLLMTYAGDAERTGPLYDDVRERLNQITPKTAASADQHQLHTELTRRFRLSRGLVRSRNLSAPSYRTERAQNKSLQGRMSDTGAPRPL
jgi:eukaryotic-like serine/threonine-protein kinase